MRFCQKVDVCSHNSVYAPESFRDLHHSYKRNQSTLKSWTWRLHCLNYIWFLDRAQSAVCKKKISYFRLGTPLKERLGTNCKINCCNKVRWEHWWCCWWYYEALVYGTYTTVFLFLTSMLCEKCMSQFDLEVSFFGCLSFCFLTLFQGVISVSLSPVCLIPWLKI